jgi:hypothetical protein
MVLEVARDKEEGSLIGPGAKNTRQRECLTT